MKHLTVIALTFFLGACGFRPLNQVVEAADLAGAPLSSVRVVTDSPDDSDDRRMAFLIKQSLESRLSEGAEPRYTLEVAPSVRRSGLAVGPDDVASRFDYNVFARITLTDRETGEKVLTDRVYAVSSFGAPRDPYGRIAAELEAAELASEEAANNIIREIALHFAK